MNSSTSASRLRPAIRVAVDCALLLACLFLFDRCLFLLFWNAQDFVHSAFPLDRKFGTIKNPADRKILIMGTSRTYEAIHPVYMRRALGMDIYKEAYVGKGPAYNYYFYQYYRRSIGVPQIAIYGIDYFVFTLHSSEKLLRIFPETGPPKPPYKRGLSLILSNKKELGDLVNDTLTEMDQRLGGRQLPINDIMPVQMDNYKGTRSMGDLPIQPSTRYKRVSYTPYPGEEGLYLDKLLQALNRDRVRVFLVVIPEFIGTYETNFERDKFIAELGRLASGYDNVQVLNYNSPDRFPLSRTRYFIDGGYGNMNSHLSANGSRVFNYILNTDLRRILRIETPEKP